MYCTNCQYVCILSWSLVYLTLLLEVTIVSAVARHSQERLGVYTTTHLEANAIRSYLQNRLSLLKDKAVGLRGLLCPIVYKVVGCNILDIQYGLV